MKRNISVILLSIVCFVLQTTIFQKLKIANISPNLLIVITAASGFMGGRKAGMFAGVVNGLMVDAMYGNTIGICILIYTCIGYLNGMLNKLYFKEDMTIPMLSIAGSDLLYGLLYFVFCFLFRGRLDLIYYAGHIIMPEMIYTLITGCVIYLFMRWMEGKLNPEKEVPLEGKE